jgi:hypothetical protein
MATLESDKARSGKTAIYALPKCHKCAGESDKAQDVRF